MDDPRQVIADILRDYRAGRVMPITPDRVGQWADQFHEHRDAVLSEMASILPGAYYNRSRVVQFLSGLMTMPELTGPDPCAFWRSMNLLEVQPAGKGSSQRELVALLRESITAHCGPAQYQGVQGGPYLYLDDGVFTGITTIRDIRHWLATAPTVATLHIIAIAIYRQGFEYARDQITSEARKLGKQLTIHWRCDKYLENSFGAIDTSDVLWPTTLPAEGVEYARTLRHSVQLRRGTSLGTQNTFATHDGRVALEQAFVKGGVKIRGQSPFNDYQRPLGNIVMESMGFGALFATYRNCPNNAPLALWAGSPWIPLLPRQNNQ